MTTRGKKVDYRALAGMKPRTAKITRKVRVRPLSAPTQVAVQQIVKRQIARKSENKMIGHLMENGVLHNSPIGAGDIVSVLTPITTGTESYQRIGDKITPKRLVVKGVLAASPEQPDNKPLYVRVLILAQKNLKGTKDVNAGLVQFGQLLRPNEQVAPNDQIPYNGTTADINRPINTDLFRVYYDRTFVIAPSKTDGGALEQNAGSVKRWSYRFKQLPSSLSYDELSQNLPNNFAPFFAVGYAYADGTNPDQVQLRITSTAQSYLSYEDA